jgi:hypothetical protein
MNKLNSLLNTVNDLLKEIQQGKDYGCWAAPSYGAVVNLKTALDMFNESYELGGKDYITSTCDDAMGYCEKFPVDIQRLSACFFLIKEKAKVYGL